MSRSTLHILGGDSRSRAEQARIAFALGHHAEVYADLQELLQRPPQDGFILAADDGTAGGAASLIHQMGESGIWLPVVLTSPEPELERVVAALKAGAIDYLRLPLETNSFAGRLRGILAEARHHAERRRQEVEAQRVVSQLSGREQEVLELLSAGHSNKDIARILAISPRTVEIHRRHMMSKLGVNHPVAAVRLWTLAQIDDPRLAVDEINGDVDRA
jgi:two-component system, LuxR family, response regulator FixJ